MTIEKSTYAPTIFAVLLLVAWRLFTDGSFRSSSVLMKEDDPLIATTLALSALLSAQAEH